MVVVVDASVALKWVLHEEGSAAALGLQSQSLIAPSYWLVEAANTLCHHVQTSRMTSEIAASKLRDLMNAPVASQSELDDLPRAIEIATRLKYAIYDCVYLALALRHDTYVITADIRFVGACVKEGNFAKNVQLLAGA